MGEEAEFEKTNILRGLFPPTSIWADHDRDLPKTLRERQNASNQKRYSKLKLIARAQFTRGQGT